LRFFFDRTSIGSYCVLLYDWIDWMVNVSWYLFLRFLQYTIRHVQPVKKGIVCNRKESICKDPMVEINSTRLVF
jgi:hypothetical protein